MRRLWSTWFLGKLLAAGLLIGALHLLQYGSAARELRVASLLVSGTELVSAAEIAESLALQNTSIFFLRARHIRAILKRDPAIADATVVFRLPDTVIVAVQERIPAAVWDTGVEQILVDLDGLALRRGSASVPTVHAPVGPLARVGERVDAAAIQIAAEMSGRLEGLGLGGARLEYQPATGMSIVLPSSYRVALGDADRLEAKLQAYRTIREHLRATRTAAQIIDVRFLDHPYFH